MKQPIAFIDFDFIAHGSHQTIALGWCKTAKLGQNMLTFHRIQHGRRTQSNGSKTIKIRLTLYEIIIEFSANPVRARDMLNEFERPSAHDVASRKTRVEFEFRCTINTVPR